MRCKRQGRGAQPHLQSWGERVGIFGWVFLLIRGRVWAGVIVSWGAGTTLLILVVSITGEFWGIIIHDF